MNVQNPNPNQCQVKRNKASRRGNKSVQTMSKKYTIPTACFLRLKR